MISAEAIEAAARALHFFKTGAGWKDANPATVWECKEQAETILRQAEMHRNDPEICKACGGYTNSHYFDCGDA